MKRVLTTSILAVVVAFTVSSCKYSDHEEDDRQGITTDLINNPNSADENANVAQTEMSFEVDKYEFGTITQGEVVAYTFKFKNTGETPLIISQVKPQCGCTDLKTWPQEPIAPGAYGEISVEFDSEGRSGAVNKSVSVVANTSPSTKLLYLRGEIITPNSGN